MKDIRTISLEELKEWMVEKGEKPFRAKQIWEWLWKKSANSAQKWQSMLDEIQNRMSEAGVHIRDAEKLEAAVDKAREQWRRISETGCRFDGVNGMTKAFNVRQLCFAHLVYLEALKSAVQSGVGSRGSALVTSPDGISPHPELDDKWNFAPENTEFRDKILETIADIDGNVVSEWKKRNQLPTPDAWFETAWAAYNKGEIYIL